MAFGGYVYLPMGYMHTHVYELSFQVLILMIFGYLLTEFYEPSTVLSVLHTQSHLIITVALQSRYPHYNPILHKGN